VATPTWLSRMCQETVTLLTPISGPTSKHRPDWQSLC
jgi:hypothetical protein